MNTLTLLIIVQGVIFGSFCSYIAKQKNRDPLGWFLLGALFSLVALIAISAVPKRESQTSFSPEEVDQWIDKK